ncbi:MAG: helix-turn-helix domain-containing protein [Candidatus Thorarchaeota archaeon]|nr:MAG: helix-turn-helix domain-containing protein [Candidatus Thorarchaeota archaeon]
MPLFEVFLKVRHDCPTGNISRRFPTLKMVEWCNLEHDVIELVTEDVDQYESVLEQFAEFSHIMEEVDDGNKVHLITKKCDIGSYDSVTNQLEGLNILDLPPVTYENGWEYRRVIAFKHEDVKKLLKRLKARDFEVEILRKIPFNGSIAGSLTLTVDSLFADLTEKQIDALLTAYIYGYFNFPRKSNVQTIAADNQVPRTTFSEHLNKAESKLVKALVPHIQLFRQALKNKT